MFLNFNLPRPRDRPINLPSIPTDWSTGKPDPNPKPKVPDSAPPRPSYNFTIAGGLVKIEPAAAAEPAAEPGA